MLYAYAFLKNRGKAKIMNAFLYTIIFIMGTLFGSFYTLAVYRIPKKIDIVKTHSFCPNCNHKLGFFELIPVWSYIFLGGKCKSCKQKIRPRYFILEILSGITFVLLAVGLKIDIYNFDLNKIVEFAFIVLYLVAIFLIAGIDKEYRKIEKSVLYYAIGISVLYIIYLCIMVKTSIYRYVMYLGLAVLLTIIDTLYLKNKAKYSYVISNLILIIIMAIFGTEATAILTVILTFILIALMLIAHKIKPQHKDISSNLPIGFCMCISNVIVFILLLLYTRLYF